MGKPVQVFLCHASEDKTKVVEVYHFLRQQGFKPWLDKEDLLPGQRWEQEIPKALRASGFILIFFSQNSVSKRGYVQREFKLALDVLEEIPEDQIFVIPVRLDVCSVPQQFHFLQYCDLFETGGIDRVVRAIRTVLKDGKQTQVESSMSPPILLRSKPVEGLFVNAVKIMLREKDFFHSGWYQTGKGPQHQYVAHERNGKKIVTDNTTGLMWQQGGSENYMRFAEAQDYVQRLNREKFGGFADWRLPTLEEAMSLMEPKHNNNDLYIDPVFSEKQQWIWTADKEAPGVAWLVDFNLGNCISYGYFDKDLFVRAVRSGQS